MLLSVRQHSFTPMQQLSNITPTFTENTGGLQLCFFVPEEDIANWPAANGLVLRGDIELHPGKVWYLLGYTRLTSRYEHRLKVDNRGGYYDLEQSGFIPSDSPALGNQLHQMKGRRFALLFRDYNGYLRVTPPGCYLPFEERYDTKEGPSDRKGYGISFSDKAPLPALYYSGGFEVSELGLLQPPVGGGNGGGNVIIRYNGAVVKVAAAGETVDVTSPFTLAFDIKFA